MNTRGIAIIGVAGVLAAIAVPAAATDLVRRSPPPLAEPLPTAPVGTTWSGFYIGGNLGAAFDPSDPSIKDLSEEQDLTLKFSNDTESEAFRAGTIGRWAAGWWALKVTSISQRTSIISPAFVAALAGQ